MRVCALALLTILMSCSGSDSGDASGAAPTTGAAGSGVAGSGGTAGGAVAGSGGSAGGGAAGTHAGSGGSGGSGTGGVAPTGGAAGVGGVGGFSGSGGGGGSGATGGLAGGTGGVAGGAIGGTAGGGGAGMPCKAPPTISWAPLGDLPFTGVVGGGVVDGALHVISQSHHTVLNTVGATWTVKQSTPSAAQASVVHGDKLHILNGAGDLLVWSAPDSWAPVASVANPRAARALSTPGGIVRVGAVFSDKKVDRIDPVTGSVSALPDVTLGEIDGAAYLDGKLYVFGDTDLLASRVVELNLAKSGAGWVERASLTPRRPAPGTGVFQGAIWRVGGVTGQLPITDIWFFDATFNAWCEGPVLPVGRAYSGVFDVGGKIVVVGGGYGTMSWSQSWIGSGG